MLPLRDREDGCATSAWSDDRFREHAPKWPLRRPTFSIRRRLIFAFPFGTLVLRDENNDEFFLSELDCEIRFAAKQLSSKTTDIPITAH
jgi:hypothetical protein